MVRHFCPAYLSLVTFPHNMRMVGCCLPLRAQRIYHGLTATLLLTLMLKAVSLVLPVLIPSWRFFKAIEPSPRVEWRVLALDAPAGTEGGAWVAYQPRPNSVSLAQMIRRLFWNPVWNDALFVVSCTERIALGVAPTSHSINEIQRRILRDIKGVGPDVSGEMLQFRLVFVYFENAGLVQDVVFMSDPFSVGAPP